MKKSVRYLFERTNDDKRRIGSLEWVLIAIAIGLPFLIFMVKFGWPKMMGYC